VRAGHSPLAFTSTPEPVLFPLLVVANLAGLFFLAVFGTPRGPPPNCRCADKGISEARCARHYWPPLQLSFGVGRRTTIIAGRVQAIMRTLDV
jgi:hypothetical protein